MLRASLRSCCPICRIGTCVESTGDLDRVCSSLRRGVRSTFGRTNVRVVSPRCVTAHSNDRAAVPGSSLQRGGRWKDQLSYRWGLYGQCMRRGRPPFLYLRVVDFSRITFAVTYGLRMRFPYLPILKMMRNDKTCNIKMNNRELFRISNDDVPWTRLHVSAVNAKGSVTSFTLRTI